MEEQKKYNVGDAMQVVNYGEHAYIAATCCGNSGSWRDHMMHIIGRTGIVSEVKDNNGERLYALKGIPEKEKWYRFDQLKQL